MQQKDQMHPDDMRNLILFAVLSIVLWLSYDHFILKPKMDAMQEAQEAARQSAVALQTEQGMGVEGERPRAAVIAETKRIDVKNDVVTGSINLKGARLDDLTLTQYFETVERQIPVTLLSPSGAEDTKYIEYGWVTQDNDLSVPTKETVWRVRGNNVLTNGKPVTLEWNNGRGLRFERVVSLNEDYGFTVKQTVINNSGKAVTLYPYALILRRDIPKDFLNRFIVHEGPMMYVGDSLTEKTFGKMSKKPKVVEEGDQGWAALTTKDWLTALVPAQNEKTKFRMTYTKGATENIKDRYQVDVLGAAKIISSGQSASYESNFFAGAKKLNLLTKYEKEWDVPHFDLTVDFGWFYFLTRPFFAVINFFYGFVGNFGIAIILFTIVLRICVFPLANTSFKSFANMRKIAPQMHELREQYADDKQKLQQELVKLYQREKVNPMAGCLPLLVQIPIFFSLFKVLSNTIEMRHAPFFGWIQDLSAPDPTSIFNLFGLIPLSLPGFLMIGAWPCLMLLTMIVQRKLNPPPSDPTQAMMIKWMPWVMTLVLAQFAAGLVIYWTFNNFFSTIQQYIIMRRMGVKVDLIGNILGQNKTEEETPSEEAAEEMAAIEPGEVEPVEEEKPKQLSKPKPKKSKKKK